MAEETTDTQSTESQETGKTFTQEEVNQLIEKRLARLHNKYADYDEIKAQLAELQANGDETEQGDELEAARKEIEELKSKIADREAADEYAALVKRVAEENRVDAKYLPLLTASDEDGLTEQAKLIAEKFAEPSPKDGGKPADVKPANTETTDFLNALSGNN